MKFISIMKKGSLLTAFVLVLSLFATVPANTALAANSTNPAAQKLVDSLHALGVEDVDYLYAYLQSVDLSTAEFNGILTNTKLASKILNGQNLERLPMAQKVEVLRLFLDSVKLAHLQATIVDEISGNSINILNSKVGVGGIVIQLKDLKGNILAVINPTRADLDPKVLDAKIKALESAIRAKEQLEKSGTFAPMPAGTLPNTATTNPDFIALGGLLMLLGGLSIIPAARLARKSKGLV